MANEIKSTINKMTTPDLRWEIRRRYRSGRGEFFMRFEHQQRRARTTAQHRQAPSTSFTEKEQQSCETNVFSNKDVIKA